ncbi:cAMP-responsive element modulator isoform X1 [Poecilia reticulata]|uniref:cAMP-responsive element modulator isoform X1 n=1 Tax=Poecilia reticulata TaxID=8081 RepID=UPI0004A2A907|nr:PREDICTED: cAMP-responsive element modulator-like isoform X1 [Poecilia reticulata]XP_008432108.1 PREDICTED: cAMP-responsive element modulator-like isoform X1 [Poecilia reticulata]
MDSLVSSQLESSLNDSVTDGEKDHGDANSSPVDSSQVLLKTESEAAVVQLSDGLTTSVQRLIQAPQTSVIQSPQVQTVQIVTVAELEDGGSVANTQKRREFLSRRPSYRKILNELSSDSPAVPKIDEEKGEDEAAVSSSSTESVPNSIYQTSSGQYIAITQGRAIPLTSPAVETLQGAQTLTVTGSPTPQTGAAILQAADSSHQFFLQGGQVLIQAATGDIPAYQLRSPNSGLAQSIVMAASPSSMQSPSSQHAEEITRKREVRLMKNREAARECRRKKKEYVKCLENRVAVLENQNKTLIEELKALKDIYCHKAE